MRGFIIFCKIIGIFPYHGKKLSVLLLMYSFFLNLVVGYAMTYYCLKVVFDEGTVNGRTPAIVVAFNHLSRGLIHLSHLVSIVLHPTLAPPVFKICSKTCWTNRRPAFLCTSFIVVHSLDVFFHYQTSLTVIPQSTALTIFNLGFINAFGVMAVVLMTEMLDTLNDRMLQITKQLSVSPIECSTKIINFMTLTEKHFKLFSLTVIVFVGKSYTSSISHVYFLITTSMPLCKFLLNIAAVVGYLGCCLYLVYKSENINSQAQAFNTELFRLMRRRDDLCGNKKLVLHVTLKHSVNFTACGFFTLGYPLITSITAGAITYLVILMQFS